MALPVFGLPGQLAAAQDMPFLEEVVPPPEIGQATIDIGRLTWRVAGTDAVGMARPDYDDSSWVARAGVSTELLRNPVAWYRFAFLGSSQGQGLGSRLELAGFEGNVAVYLNGVPVGEARGETLPPYERREAFTLPASLLREDRNVLAIRITGFAGRPRVGIPRGPVRLLPLSASYERQDQAIRAAREAGQAAAWQAAATALAASVMPPAPADVATGSLAFGRFGREHHEGLLTASLWPGGFQGATTSFDARPIAGYFGVATSAPVSDMANLEAISPEGKIVRAYQPGIGRYRLYYPLLYPGFAVEPLDATLSVRFETPMDVMWVDRWGVTTQSARADGRLPWTEPWALFHDPAGKRPPFLIALPSPKSDLRLRRTSDGWAVILPPRTTARFCWPTGIAPWGPPAATRDMAAFRAWAQAMVPFSRISEETAKGDRLTIRETFRYLHAGAVPYAPLPPAFGALQGVSFIAAERARDLGVPTLAGPLWAVPRSAEIKYELPLPSFEVGAVPRREGVPPEPAGELPDALVSNAMDLAHTKRVDAFLRWPRLSKAGRQALEANGAVQLPRAWGPLAWAETAESLTGTTYRWSVANLGRDGRFEGFARANGLALLGTAIASVHTGDWSIAATQWQRLRRSADWFFSAFDWAWQAPADTDAGVSSGDRPERESVYQGALGLSQLAQVVAPAEALRYRALAARLRPVLDGTDALTGYARRTGLLDPALVWDGFAEAGVLGASPSSQIPEASPSADFDGIRLLTWAPARLEDLVLKPKSRTLELRLGLKQAAEIPRIALRCPKPAEVLWASQPAAFEWAEGSQILTFSPGRASGVQTLLVKF
jgi:hypothetical protein